MDVSTLSFILSDVTNLIQKTDQHFTDQILNSNILRTKRVFSKIQKVIFIIFEALSYKPKLYFDLVIPLRKETLPTKID